MSCRGKNQKTKPAGRDGARVFSSGFFAFGPSPFGRINFWYGWFLALQIASYFLFGWAVENFSLGWWSPQSSWDGRIPFLPFMIIPYLLYFPVMAAPLFAPMKKGEGRFLLLCLISASVINYSASFTLEAGLSPRVSFEGKEGFFILLIGILYKIDISPLHFPSLHSLHSLLIGVHLWRAGGLWRIFLPFALLITVSTVFIKQHFLWDSLASLFLAPAVYGGAAFLLQRPLSGQTLQKA